MLTKEKHIFVVAIGIFCQFGLECSMCLHFLFFPQRPQLIVQSVVELAWLLLGRKVLRTDCRKMLYKAGTVLSVVHLTPILTCIHSAQPPPAVPTAPPLHRHQCETNAARHQVLPWQQRTAQVRIIWTDATVKKTTSNAW